MKEGKFWEWWHKQALNSFLCVEGAYNYWKKESKEKKARMGFLQFRSNALQSLALAKDFPPNYWSKDDVENWVKKEYKKHYGEEK